MSSPSSAPCKSGELNDSPPDNIEDISLDNCFVESSESERGSRLRMGREEEKEVSVKREEEDLGDLALT